MSIKKIETIKIYKGRRFAGLLSRTKNGASFKYDVDYLNDPDSNHLCFHIKKREAAYEVVGVNLHPFFAGLLPEGLRIKALIRGLKTSEDDLFSLFSALGTSCVGDVYPEDPHPPTKTELPSLGNIVFEAYFNEMIARSVERVVGNDTFAGVQNKISAAVISLPISVAKHTESYILKLNNSEFPNVVRNEFICMALARKCQVNAAKCKIIKDKEGNEGLLVSRFDRVWREAQSNFTSLHLEDACQFMDVYPSEKYRLNMRGIAENIETFSQTPEIDIIELILQYFFSYLIGNGDMHAKNISLLQDASGKTYLSPAYDLVSTLAYPLDQNMALRIDGRDENFKLNQFLKFAERFNVPKVALEERMLKLLAIYSDQLPNFLNNMSEVLTSDKAKTKFEQIIKKRMKGLGL